jgi:hypothetical protein
MDMEDVEEAITWWQKAYTCLHTLSGNDSAAVRILHERLTLLQRLQSGVA